jgi:hypothetical protein
MLEQLEHLEHETHLYVHKENNVLFEHTSERLRAVSVED